MNIAAFKTKVASLRQSGTIADISDFYGTVATAASILLSKADPIETLRAKSFGNFQYNAVATYPLPADNKAPIALIPVEIAPQKTPTRNPVPFDLQSGLVNNAVSLVTVNGVPSIQIDWTGKGGKLIHSMTSFSGNGTWRAVGTTTGIVTHTTNKIGGKNVVEFTVNAQGDGIRNTNFSPVDIIIDERRSVVIFPVYIDNGANISGVRVSLGNSQTLNFVNLPVQTTQANGDAFITGVNYIAIPWKNETKDSLVTLANVNAMRIQFNCSAATLIRVGSVMLSLGYLFLLKYYSNCLFIDGNGAWISTPTQDSDSIVVTDAMLDALAYEVLYLLGGADMILARDKLYGDPTSGKAEDAVGIYRLYGMTHESRRTISYNYSI